MKICENCFNDEELKAVLRKSNNNEVLDCCPNCGNHSVLYDTEDTTTIKFIKELFEAFLDSYKVHDAGALLIDELQSVWKVFNSQLDENTIMSLMQSICKDYFNNHRDLLTKKIVLIKKLDSEYVKQHSILKNISWTDFRKQLKEENRYHPSNINIDVLKSLFSYIESDYQPNSLPLYRARRSREGETIEKRNMGAPKPGKSGEGRINAKGVACLYLATDEQTCIKEIRAGVFDIVCIGEFQINSPIKLVNLSKINKISPFKVPYGNNAAFDIAEIDINRKFLEEINDNIRTPQASSDDPLDYIGTQYISDYIKSITDDDSKKLYDGIEFASTHSQTERNIVLFETSLDTCKCECVNVLKYYISSVEYQRELRF